MAYMDPPDNPGTFGQEFNYAVWTPGTTVTLCNVPWYSDYRDVVYFDTQKELDDYLTERSGPTVPINSMMYARPGYPVRINVPFNDAYMFNYLRVHNPAQPVGESGPRTFYYFISDVNFIAPNTTELVVQLDVWQTFIRNIEFGHSYIERGHIGIANEYQMWDYGRKFLTIPEGLDLGSEYGVNKYWSHKLGNHDDYDVIVITTVSFHSGGTVDDPELKTAEGSTFEDLPNGAALYFMSKDDFLKVMDILKDYPWISQGIISIYAVPPLQIPETEYWKVSPLWLNDSSVVIGSFAPSDIGPDPYTIPPQHITLENNWRDTALSTIPERYQHLKKFLTYPYAVIELTTNSGNPLILKPEGITDDNLSAIMLQHIAPPNARISFYPYRYNGAGSTINDIEYNADGSVYNDKAEFLDMTTGIFNFPSFSTVNNSYTAFLASNANSIAYQYQQADWSQQRALRGNQVEYGQASQQMALQNQLNRLNVNAMGARTDLANTTGAWQAGIGAASSIGQGLMTGSPIGVTGGVMNAATAGLSHAVEVNQRNQTLGIESNLANRSTRAQVNTAGYMRDTNKEFADYAAKGDYEVAVAGINAKVQDAEMIQPTTSGQVGGDAMNFVHYQWGIDAKLKMLTSGARDMVGEYWLRYGYAIHRFLKLPKNLKVMDKFSYWKTMETYLSSSTCPEMFRQTIRGILEKGVTVWSDPSDIGVTDIGDNRPLEGIRYFT